MNQQEYISKVERLRQIEAQVKDPSFSLDRVEELLEESAAIVRSCKEYTRGLRERLEDDKS